jgi:hypothetical protein
VTLPRAIKGREAGRLSESNVTPLGLKSGGGATSDGRGLFTGRIFKSVFASTSLSSAVEKRPTEAGRTSVGPVCVCVRVCVRACVCAVCCVDLDSHQ